MKFLFTVFKRTFFGICLAATYVCATHESITICGTGDSQQLLSNLAQAYEAKHPSQKIIIPNSIGSKAGIKNTAEGKCDLGRIARTLKQDELEQGLNYVLFAYSPVVFVTNINIAAISNLNEQDIMKIYSGKINWWSEINASISGKIYPIVREPSDASHGVIKKGLSIENFEGKVIFSTPEAVTIVAQHKNTIGYMPLSAAINNNLSILKINNIAPTQENVLNKSYKLVSPFGLVYKGVLDELSKNFVEFIQSKEAKAIMEKNGAIQVEKVEHH